MLGGEQRLLFLHKARKGRAYVSDQRDGLLYVKRVTYEQLVYKEKGQVSDLSTFNKKYRRPHLLHWPEHGPNIYKDTKTINVVFTVVK